jgi:mitochondrial fission protein ELM1
MRVWPRRPWTWLPAGCWPVPLSALGPGSDELAPPWPDLLITTGRRSVPYGLLVKRLSGGRTFTVHIQRPQTRTERFDLVVAPRHDRLC